MMEFVDSVEKGVDAVLDNEQRTMVDVEEDAGGNEERKGGVRYHISVHVVDDKIWVSRK